MNRGINLIINTKSGAVKTGFLLTTDSHVDLAYRVVEAGIFGTMVKKHWSFAILDGDEILASAPMYRSQTRDGHSRYLPRIAPNAVRGSVAGLLLMLEALADGARARSEMATREVAEEVSALEEHIAKTSPGGDTQVPEGQREGAEPEGVSTPEQASEELVKAAETLLNAGAELVPLEGGGAVLVQEWTDVGPDQARVLGFPQGTFSVQGLGNQAGE